MEGFFEWLPKALRLWFFARLNPRQLPKLRVNKALQKFIDEEVYPYIEVQLESLLEGRQDYARQEHAFLCRQCNCRVRRRADKNLIGVRIIGVRIPCVYTFARYPDEYQPSGYCYMWEAEPALLSGVCYRCVFVHGLSSSADLNEPSKSE